MIKRIKNMTKADTILILLLLVLSLSGFFLDMGRKAEADVLVSVQVDGKEVDRLYLREGVTSYAYDTQFGKNTVEIVDGRAHMEHADCPDQLCLHQGYIDHSGQMIVCLPNRFVVEILSKEEGKSVIDGFTR